VEIKVRAKKIASGVILAGFPGKGSFLLFLDE